MIIVLQNRTIECSKCGRIDMFTTETLEDMREIAEDQGWLFCFVRDECEVRGICPACAGNTICGICPLCKERFA